MKEKNNNDEYAKLEFEKRLKATKKKAIEENVKLARKTGNKQPYCTTPHYRNIVIVGNHHFSIRSGLEIIQVS